MAECIVCKANYAPGELCQRCGSDNSAWEEWVRNEETTGASKALLNFLSPYLGLPLMIAGWSLAFGLLGMIWPWGGVRPSVLILVIALTFVGCVLAPIDVHAKRFDLREQELLRRVRRGWRNEFGLEMQILLVPAIILGLAMLLTLSTVQSRMSWEMLEWLVLEDTTAVEETPSAGALLFQEELGLKEKVKRVFPLMCLSGYVTLAAFAYSSSLMLAQEYISRLNKRLPQPIFLREDLLIEVVQREAERIVHRTPRVIGDEKTPAETERGPGNWIWNEMERTDDGGVRLKATVKVDSKMSKSPTGEQIEHPVYVTYVVEADPWSRIIRVVRVKESQ